MDTKDAVKQDEHKGTLSIISSSGDDVVVWNMAQTETVDQARQAFMKKFEAGYNAYAFYGNGRPGEVINTFDPTAERIILAPQMAGG